MFEGPWPALYWFELGFLLRVCNTLKILYVLYRFQCHEHEHNKKPRVPNHLQVMQHYNIYIYIYTDTHTYKHTSVFEKWVPFTSKAGCS